ncbi:MAG: Asp-tRNA(Asn)/Glu-tRNA(Gln) amidotransferase subunit GatC [Gammaproteobacteria bacterium]|nr:Asp-tRNA(Asn)/Glu-tRNA(Gln) amidotransferase subunit GatC [Gammaproteobacteria bacterium]MBT3870691.1 Asp-tRNA(Asn)/Glu-tRNA(Gln) amidotransferase subunit GatC [Gammaproteobacteria bacterium]MBT4380553.1 Asp-tRNA(Asn)/Glu-tRNA(Gln) amidotransferase subunit GatC [Gammaproteobacteria bacterium]MBT4617426.1 Asp-tRNA(Asn)/Glu-tRNA(Gln) amidotransferase subunit GatC [Gammaproteobacteria bacterium]MBT5196673.1 Asp-tRNA(Asn)/Glu-tRNA(Gln) amidotransferase subunit GatC [Gammaproteobacteria bacterium
MDVTEEVVRNIAELVQLKVDDADIQQLAEGMQNILALADQMQAINTEGVEPVSNPLDASQKLRPDVVTEENQRELFQSLAPATESGLYLVPRVVE